MEVELAIAKGTAVMTADMPVATKYLTELDTVSNNIKAMFEKQAATSEEPWDQAHFEELLAKWVAACERLSTQLNSGNFSTLTTGLENNSKFPTPVRWDSPPRLGAYPPPSVSPPVQARS
ncbi:Transposase-like protein [Mycena venus]|uniref:Transposase-like protein n=1 Tax=Mycena venus TaxID=2733690 RepID=A0A8H7CQ21_9AGAR|nr:Transposase-like protein [Mycena venus]